eukprot:TRINITY_DN33383_c0_g1_i1.p1 TRINITY_DN33383_c0_g1~~TRINITY_DN33383_c0_g1_i1.p1  ORF type:complete len:306 (+),score=50.52 TRINITY_DN33383_c0_g1_i1:121-918(+)
MASSSDSEDRAEVAQPQQNSRRKKNNNLGPLSCCKENPLLNKSGSVRGRKSGDNYLGSGDDYKNSQTLASIIKNTLLVRRRLRLNPDGKLYFIYEPGKQVSSAVRIKNVSKSYVAFKFQTNSPKSCFMRPPSGILAPKESILATVTKFLEQPEQTRIRKTKEKFKVVSLKVKKGVECTPELFEEQREKIISERILKVVFLDPKNPSKVIEKLRRRLAEADAIHQAQKKAKENAPKVPVPDGAVDEWKERRERYLAQQQEDVLESL